MKIIEAYDYKDMCRKTANIISAQVLLKSESVLGLATGSTPIGVYDILAERYKRGDLDFSQIRTVNLDEYKGLDPENPHSYRYFMNENLFSKINIDINNTFVPKGMNSDIIDECESYERIIGDLGGIDLQLLGLGHNAHIGFNEPADCFTKLTHCVLLTERTIQANKRFFEDIENVPKEAYTMGIGTIMSAKKILVIVAGEDKAEAVKESFGENITPYVPASVLQLHNDVTVIADKAALSKLY
ncbi:MAG: glucosamine-6-phosphate deaminase [Lachnospiraceae bacterium]|nr:glucosamine-6-phosphate deaminase [Lachnospiraceae bacterium]